MERIHKQSLCLFLLYFGFAAVLLTEGGEAADGTGVHIAYLTDCTMYSDWQTVGMVFSYKQSRQPVNSQLTRIMCCTDEERKRYNEQLLSIVQTHVAPSFAHNEKTKDWYAAYNKPGAVVDWMKHVTPKEDWVLVLDSDMYLRKPFYPQFFNATRGWCVSADYTYMIGVNNELAVRHIPEIAPRDDELAGPRGRRGDQVGGFFFMHRDDLSRVAPLWLQYTEDVREDPEAWRLSGDQYVEKGGKPWISEMYGYAFGAAKANVWHKWDKKTMMYPTYRPTEGIPKLMHYGLLFEVGKNYSFDKHWHYDFDVTACPPWDLTDPKRRVHGVFPSPPRPSTLDKSDFIGFYRDLLAIETLSTLNAAFCDYHISHCPPSEQLVTVCKEVFSLYNEAREFLKEAESRYDCQNFHPKCQDWADVGECKRNVGYMTETCRRSCKLCHTKQLFFPETTTKDLEEKLAKMEKALQPLAEDPDQKKGASGTAPKEGVSPVIIPKQDQPVVIVPRNLKPEESTASPKVGFPSPAVSPSPPPSSPSPSPPPSSPPPSSPSPPPPSSPPPSPPTKKEATKESASKEAASKEVKMTTKQLTVRCYRLTLPADEVRDCVKAAKDGIEYQPKPNSDAIAADAALRRTSTKEADSETKTTKPAKSEAAVEQNSESGAEEKKAVVEPADKPARVVSRDLEDLTITQQGAKKGKAPVLDTPHVFSMFGGLNKWQALLLWLVVVLAFLALMPRIARLRRRARSGMRTE